MPKLNGYRALHTTVVGPEGRPLEIQVRTREMHETAEFGVAAHWLYKGGSKDGQADEEWLAWIRQLMDWQEDETDPREFIKTLPHRPLRRRGLRLHAQGRGQGAAVQLDADRLRLRGPHRRRPPHRRREDQRPDRAAPLPAEERRLRRDPYHQGRARPVARLALARRVLASAQQDPPVVLARDARGDRAEGPRGARVGAEEAEPAVQEAPGLGRARAGDPRDRLQEGRGLLPRARLGEARGRPDREQGDPAAEDRGGRRRGGRPAQGAEGAARRLERELRHHRPRGRRRARPAREVLHARFPGTRSSATSRSARGSRSTARTART